MFDQNLGQDKGSFSWKSEIENSEILSSRIISNLVFVLTFLDSGLASSKKTQLEYRFK